MAGGRRRREANDVVKEEKRSAKEDVEVMVLEEEEEKEEDSLKAQVAKLRQRWELASVLDFLIVFEPVVGKASKISAEEIEMGLINPGGALAQLHIALLKGIPPASKALDGSDAWVTVLCKKLATWWPWVAEGEIPLVAAKGEEISRYKELDPTKRLLLLKALCELRADQDDALAYINDALKQGTEVSFFRKNKIGGDGNGTSYWYEGTTITGHRLYKEVTALESKAKSRGKGCLNLANISLQWETLATNLEEFRKVVDELSSSKVVADVSVAKIIETNAIPVLEKLQKKKERALKQKERQERHLNTLRNSCGAGTTRSCRNRRPVSYTFEEFQDEYDRAIHEAIKVTNGKRTADEKRQEGKRRRRNGTDTNGAPQRDTNSEDNSGKKSNSNDSDANDSGNKDDSAGSDTSSDRIEEVASDDDDNNWDDGGTKDEDKGDHSDSGKSETDKNHAQTDSIALKPMGVRWSKRLAGDTSHPVLENRNLGTKNRSRQRPICNSALDSVVRQDSDDENSSEHANSEIAGHDELPVTDPEEVGES
ncbi:DDT domain-containing protein DDR4 isoform X1 [Prunus persica]|uniref:DDT domain-containing protein DDR4 isoform X1 n=1 Tax=Prunus persica TaxID=3760 RepID=UPI0009AB2DCD|nr:DDT domain-containing protein DDR4 isoform X1 [Prunus persica]